MAYEVFQRSAVRVSTPSLAVSPLGLIAFNAAACRLLIEAGVKSVVILWDRSKCRIAVKAAPRGERNSFTVTINGGSHSGGVRAKSFFRHIGWVAPKRVPLATTWNAAERMFEATLPRHYIASSKGKAE